MPSQTFGKWLREIFMCHDLVKCVSDMILAEAWRTCKRADWMFWLCEKHIGENGWPTRQEIVLAACDCAEIVKHLWPKDNNHSARAIETARAWVRGKASIEEVKATVHFAADSATCAAAHAAEAAYADYANDDDDDGTSAAHAAANVHTAAAFAVPYAARRDAHLKMCTIIRNQLHPTKF